MYLSATLSLVGLISLSQTVTGQQYLHGLYGGDFAPLPSSEPAYGSSANPAPDNTCSSPAPSQLTFPTPNEGCFPNIMKDAARVDPLQQQGTYYEFRSRFSDQQVYNTRYVNTLVCDGLVYLPGTYIPAVHYSEDYRYITLSKGAAPSPANYYGYSSQPAYDGQQASCNYNFLDILQPYNGIVISNTFGLGAQNAQPASEVYYFLFVRPGERGVEIQYLCSDPNYETGICNAVQVFVYTRVNPSQMTREENDEVEEIIDRVLAPYCMSRNDLQKVIHRADLNIDQCNMAPPEAFTSLVNGYASSLPKRKPSDRPY